MAVFFGGTHAYAFSHDHDHDHDPAHAGSLISASHDVDEESDDQNAGDSQGKEAAHGHNAMDAAPNLRGVGLRLFKAGCVLPIQDVMALPSLGIAPPLEPPSA